MTESVVPSTRTRNDAAPVRGTFRVKGDVLEICPADEEVVLRFDFFGDEIEKIEVLDHVTGEVVKTLDNYMLFPASHFVAGEERMEKAMVDIEKELAEQLDYPKNHWRAAVPVLRPWVRTVEAARRAVPGGRRLAERGGRAAWSRTLDWAEHADTEKEAP